MQKLEVEKIVSKYCNDIIKENIPSCLYVKKAVRRFIKDKRNKTWEYYLDWNKVQQFYDFSKLIRLPDKNACLEMLPWQLFIFANLLGFYYKDNPDKMRFRQGAVFVPRKNGKTVGLLYPLLLWDFLTTESSESYFFEKDDKQGAKVFLELKYIINQMFFGNTAINMTVDSVRMKNSRIAYFTSESVGIDGYRPSMAVIDEYWCFPDNRCITAMQYGGRSRLNNLVLIITTAGTNIGLPAYHEQEKVQKLLSGRITDDTYFGIVYTVDEGDSLLTSESYIKANPSIDKIIDRKILGQDMEAAINTPAFKPDYLAKTLNVWQTNNISWIPLERWDALDKREINWKDFEGQPCFGAIDLSSVHDFTVFTLCFKRRDCYYFKHRFYIPEETIRDRYRKENIGVLEWIERGLITPIAGPTIDYTVLYEDIKKDLDRFRILEIAYDQWNSFSLINMLESDSFSKNLTLIPYLQNLKSLSGPTKMYEKLIYERKICDPSPLLRWMVQNTKVKPDINGNYKPLKSYVSGNSTERIDGVITSIIALDRTLAHDDSVLSINDLMDLL